MKIRWGVASLGLDFPPCSIVLFIPEALDVYSFHFRIRTDVSLGPKTGPNRAQKYGKEFNVFLLVLSFSVYFKRF